MRNKKPTSGEDDRIREDPYYELANAVVKQAADDYCNAYRTWFATYETQRTRSLVKIGRKYRYTTLAIEREHDEAERQIRDCIRFFHSSWFATLTKLNPTALQERLRKKSLNTSYLRNQLGFMDQPNINIQRRNGQRVSTQHSVLYMVGEVNSLDRKTMVVKTTSYKSADNPNEYTFKYFPLDVKDWDLSFLDTNEPVAVTAVVVEDDPLENPSIPINIVQNLKERQFKFEESYMDLLREAARARCTGVK